MTELRCFDPADTELFRRGYPHLVQLVDDDHPIPAAPARPPRLDLLYRDYWGTYADCWPRTLARQFVRTFPVDRTLKIAPVAGAETIDAAEVERLLAAMCATQDRASPYTHRSWLFALEAFAGTDVVLPALVAALAAVPAQRRYETSHLDEIVAYLGYLVGFLLLRARPSVARAARRDLTALWDDATRGTPQAYEGNLRGSLDLALHGIVGARRVLTDSHWQYLHWWGFVDDATLLNERFTCSWKSEWHVDPRHLWLAGEAVMPILLGAKAIRALRKQRGLVFAQLAKLDHPEVARVMSAAHEDKYGGAIAVAYGARTAKAAAKPKSTVTGKEAKSRSTAMAMKKATATAKPKAKRKPSS